MIQMKENGLLYIHHFWQTWCDIDSLLLNDFNRHPFMISTHLPYFRKVLILESYPCNLPISEYPAHQSLPIVYNSQSIYLIPNEIPINYSTIRHDNYP